MARTNILPIIPLLFFLSLCIPVLIGVYVYRDAARRGMNAALWVLVAILAPGLIGFIIYLLVRGGWPDLRCPRCGNPVREQYVVCPKCGGKLRPACPNCAEPVETDWSVCPRCAQPLPKFYEDVTVPERPRDRTLSKIILAVILIPVLLIVLLLVLFSAQARSGGWSSTAVTLPVEGLLETQETKYVRDWLDSLEPDGRAYALAYTAEDGGGDEVVTRYLVYISGTDGLMFSSIALEDGFFSTSYALDLMSDGKGEDTILYVELVCEKPPRLIVRLNGAQLDCLITQIDFDPALAALESLYE